MGYFCPTCDSLLLHSSYCVGDFARAMGNYKIGFMLYGELVTDYGRFQKLVNAVHEPKIDVSGVLKQFIGMENPTQ